jgi:hypothetical protein
MTPEQGVAVAGRMSVHRFLDQGKQACSKTQPGRCENLVAWRRRHAICCAKS